jgi:hypothetical protein
MSRHHPSYTHKNFLHDKACIVAFHGNNNNNDDDDDDDGGGDDDDDDDDNNNNNNKDCKIVHQYIN